MNGLKLRVRDVHDPERMTSLIVDEEEEVVEVIRRFAEQHHIRGVFIVNRNGKLTGVLTRFDLLNYAKVKLRKDLSDVLAYDEAIKYFAAVKIWQIASRRSREAKVTLDDGVVKALQIMTAMDLIDIPVVDDEGKIVGDLSLSEILLKLISLSEES